MIRESTRELTCFSFFPFYVYDPSSVLVSLLTVEFFIQFILSATYGLIRLAWWLLIFPKKENIQFIVPLHVRFTSPIQILRHSHRPSSVPTTAAYVISTLC